MGINTPLKFDLRGLASKMLQFLESAANESAAILGPIGLQKFKPWPWFTERPDGACSWFASDAASDSGRVGSC